MHNILKKQHMFDNHHLSIFEYFTQTNIFCDEFGTFLYLMKSCQSHSASKSQQRSTFITPGE